MHHITLWQMLIHRRYYSLKTTDLPPTGCTPERKGGGVVPGGLDIYLDVSEGGKGYVISVHYSMQTLNAKSVILICSSL